MGPSLGLPRPQGQHRLGAVERLNLRLLVDAQHERLVRWIEGEPDDVPDFVNEQRVLRQLERLDPMRLQRERPPGHATVPPFGE